MEEDIGKYNTAGGEELPYKCMICGERYGYVGTSHWCWVVPTWTPTERTGKQEVLDALNVIRKWVNEQDG